MIKVLFFILLIVGCVYCDEQRCAFVTTLLGVDHDFVYGATALGRSLIMSNASCNIDRVLLHDNSLSSIDKDMLMRKGGWMLKFFDAPKSLKKSNEICGTDHSTNNNMNVLSLIEYDTVVYLAADTLVLENIDGLCQVNVKIAGVHRNHSFHESAVMVLKPALEYYDLIYDRIEEVSAGVPSVTLPPFGECALLDPRIEYDPPINETFKCGQLLGAYAGDVVLQSLENKWVVGGFQPHRTLKVIHYVAPFIKPWRWEQNFFHNHTDHWWYVWDVCQSIDSPRNAALTVEFLKILIAFSTVILWGDSWGEYLMNRLYRPHANRRFVLFFFIITACVASLHLSFQMASLAIISPFHNTFLFLLAHAMFMYVLIFKHLGEASYVATGLYLIKNLALYLVGLSLVGYVNPNYHYYYLTKCVLVSHWFLIRYMFFKRVIKPLQQTQ